MPTARSTEKWVKHWNDQTFDSWLFPFPQKDYKSRDRSISGSLSYCPKCKNIYDYLHVKEGVKLFLYPNFPNLIPDNKYRKCEICEGKVCKIEYR